MSTEIFNKIRKKIIDTGRDDRYKLNAYLFVVNGIEYLKAKVGDATKMTGKNLSVALVEFAQKQFGPMSFTVLSSWGIHCTDDFGYLVYNMIDIGLLRKQEDDKLQDFFDVVDLKKELKSPEYFKIDPIFIKCIQGA